MRQQTLGNGLIEQTAFNSRLQPVEIKLGTANNATDRLQLNYEYGMTENNGNVRSQRITVPGLSQPLVQTYQYDALNRLSSASETVNGVQSWQQMYAYDRFGNRRFKLGTTLPDSADIEHDALHNPTINPATNRFDAGQGYGYDEGASNSAGNLTSAPGYTFTYDAENRIVTSNDAPPNQQALANSYAYDGDGRRVQKVSSNGQVAEVYVYDASGQLVAEYNNLLRERQSEMSYLTSDSLGTPRVATKADGSVKSRHDYLPFGEELGSEMGGRNSVPQYGQSDGVKQKFTGYERDDETNLDYAQARYYVSVQGRFTSPDPLLASGDPSLPQSWNRYSYVLSNPLKYIDPTGLDWGYRDGTDGLRYFRWFDGDVGTDELGQEWTKYNSSYFIAGDGTGYWLDPNSANHQEFSANSFSAEEWNSLVATQLSGGNFSQDQANLIDRARARQAYRENQLKIELPAAIVSGSIERSLEAQAERSLFRLITQEEPPANLLSNAARGLAPRGPEVTNQALHQGLSMFDSLEGAAARIPILERGGNRVLGIAEFRIPSDAAGITITKTLGRGHFTIMGEAPNLQRFWFQSILKSGGK